MNQEVKKSYLPKTVSVSFASIIVTLIIASACVVLGNITGYPHIIFIGAMIALVTFTVKYFQDYKQNMIAIIFNVSIFVFLLGRYLVRMIGSMPMDVGSPYIDVALSLVFVTTVVVNLSYTLSYKKEKELQQSTQLQKYNWARLKMFSVVGFAASAVCALYANMSLLSYATSNGYNALYVGPDLGIPLVIALLGDMLPFFAALLLAGLPTKRATYIIFISYIIALLPALIAGKRMALFIILLVWVSYVVLRHARAGLTEQRWIGKKEKVLAIILIPILVLLTPVIGSLRGGTSFSGNALESTLDGQGVTLEVIAHGVQFQQQLPKSIYGTYTFAPLVDYLSTNVVSRAVFGTKEIPTQTQESAEAGKSYADALSYLVLWNSLYLAGQGLGSSYVIETYTDFGFIGLILFSLFVGLLLRWMSNNFGKSYFRTFLVVLLMIQVYALPRNTSTEMLVAILQIQTVLLIAAIFVYDTLMKGYVRSKKR